MQISSWRTEINWFFRHAVARRIRMDWYAAKKLIYFDVRGVGEKCHGISSAADIIIKYDCNAATGEVKKRKSLMATDSVPR